MKKLSNCKNLGKTIIKNLESIDVKDFETLEKLGPVEIYKRITKKYPEKTWPVCYYLYSIEGALLNKHWDNIGNKRKSELLRLVGK